MKSTQQLSTHSPILVLALTLALALPFSPPSSVQAQNAAPATAAVDPGKFPEVVARVNGLPISKTELLTQATLVRAQIKRAGGGDPSSDLTFYRLVLEGLVNELLIFDDAKKRNLLATDREIEHFFKGLQGAYPDEASFTKALTEQGTDVVKVKAQLRQSLSIEKAMRQDMLAKAKVSEDEARSLFDQTRDRYVNPEAILTRHILLKIDPAAGPAAKEKARQRLEQIRRRVIAGEDFAKLARELSEDSETASRGGELPWAVPGKTSQGQMLLKLALDEISPIIESERSISIVQVLQKRPSQPIPFEQVKAKLMAEMEKNNFTGLIQDRLDALRAAAKIELAI